MSRQACFVNNSVAPGVYQRLQIGDFEGSHMDYEKLGAGASITFKIYCKSRAFTDVKDIVRVSVK
jgi:hypothetical protein